MKIQSRDNRRPISKEPQNSSENGKKTKNAPRVSKEKIPKRELKVRVFYAK